MRDRYASLREGLVGAWIPSISGSGLLLPDLSGQGNNGTLTNMGPEDWVSGEYGRALDFDGVDDYVDCGKNINLQLANKYTLSSWVFINSNPSGSAVITERFTGGGNTVQCSLGFNISNNFSTRVLQTGFYSGSWQTASGLSEVVPLGEWVFVCGTWDGVNLRLFQGGTQVAQTASGSVLPAQDQGYSIGRRHDLQGFVDYFPGQLDDIRIYNRALSEPEIKLLSQEPGIGFKRTRSVFDFGRKPAYLPPTPTDYRAVRVKQTEHASLREGLVGAWCPSIEGSGYKLPDLSGQGNNGTLTNMDASDWVSSQYGRALDFDGVNDYVAFQKNPISKYPFSIAFFFRVDSNPTLAAHFVAAKKSSVNNWVRLLYTSADGIIFQMFNGSTSYTLSNAVSLNKWYHATAVVDSAAMELHIDGTEAGSISHTIAESIIAGLDSLSLGYLLNYGQYLDGQLDDVRIYNRALSEPEIKLLASRPGIGLRNNRKVFDFNRQVTYSPKVSPYYRTIKANKTEHASLREGLVGAWIPSVSGSGLNLPDLSGQANHGTLTNMGPEDWVSSQYGRALDFDGSGDHITLPRTVAVNTVATWFRIPNNPPVNFEHYAVGSSSGVRGLIVGGTYFGSKAAYFDGFQSVVTDVTINDGKWHHVAATINDYYHEIYLDGTKRNATTFSRNLGLQINRLGRRSDGLGFLDGQLDDIRIYNRVLSESEIKLLASEPGIGFKSSPKTFDFGKKPVLTAPQVAPDYRTVRVKQTEHASLREGLVGAWCPSIEGDGYTLPDLSGQGNNGTLTNMGPEDWVSGQYGRALDFDGVNDYVGTNFNPSTAIGNGNEWSVSLWLNQVAAKNNARVLGNSLSVRWYIATSTTVVFWGWGSAFSTSTGLTLSFGKWQHVVISYNIATIAIECHLDGHLTSSVPYTGNGLFTSALTQIGDIVASSLPFNGQLDDIRIYNRALSESEIKLLASRPGIGLRPQRRTMYYGPPNIKRNNLLTSYLF